MSYNSKSVPTWPLYILVCLQLLITNVVAGFSFKKSKNVVFRSVSRKDAKGRKGAKLLYAPNSLN